MNQNEYLIYANRLKLARLSLRIGLASVFGFAAFEAFFRSTTFLQYIPHFVTQVIASHYFLPMFGTAEIFLALWLLSGIKIRYAAIMSFFLMAVIVGFNPEYFSILFRNIAIGFAALALALLEEVKSISINSE